MLQIVVTYFFIVGFSNAVNLTDGLDGLAIMPTVLVGGALGVFAYVTGNVNFSGYLGIPYVAGTGEILVFCAALAGAGLGFLWFNTYPAQVFMGDIGALSLGAALGARCCCRPSGNCARDHGRCFRRGNTVGDHPGCVVQVNGQARLSHGAAASPFRTQRLGRAQGDCSLLDHHSHSRADRLRESEDTMKAATKIESKNKDLVLGLGAPACQLRVTCVAMIAMQRSSTVGMSRRESTSSVMFGPMHMSCSAKQRCRKMSNELSFRQELPTVTSY